MPDEVTTPEAKQESQGLPENWEKAPEVQTLISEMIKKSTEGLKNKRDELLGEVKKFKEIAKGYDGIDIEKAREAMEKVRELEEKKLMDEGNVEELFKQRTERMKEDHEKQLINLQKINHSREEEINNYKNKLSEITIETGIREAIADLGVELHRDAWGDLVRRAKDTYRINEMGNAEPRERGGELIYGKDGISPLTYSEYIQDLIDKASHLFRDTGGTGTGSTHLADTSRKTRTVDKNDMKAFGANLEDIAKGKIKVVGF